MGLAWWRGASRRKGRTAGPEDVGPAKGAEWDEAAWPRWRPRPRRSRRSIPTPRTAASGRGSSSRPATASCTARSWPGGRSRRRITIGSAGRGTRSATSCRGSSRGRFRGAEARDVLLLRRRGPRDRPALPAGRGSPMTRGRAMAETTGAGPPTLERYREYLRLLARLRLGRRLRGSSTRRTWSSRRCCGPTRRSTGFRGAGERGAGGVAPAGPRDHDGRRGPAVQPGQARRRRRADAAGVARRVVGPPRGLARGRPDVAEPAGDPARAARSCWPRRWPRCPRTSDGPSSCTILKGHSLADVGRQMGRSKAAVAGLLRRGLEELRRG